MADLAEVGAIGGELEELGGGCAVGGTGGVSAGEDEDVAFGVDGYSGGFAEIDVWWELEEVGDGVEWDLRDGLVLSE